jgi:hypothetical protein
LKRSDVKVAAVPFVCGLFVTQFLAYAKSKPSMVKYLPEERDWAHIDKQWLLDVMYSLDQEGV